MAVFDDPKKELEQLQSELLEQDELFQRELESARRMIEENPRNRKAARSAREEDWEELVPRKKGVLGLLILAAVELLGIAGILGYWALVLLR